MGIRKGIFIGAVALSIMACAACGSSEGNVSGTNGVETSTGREVLLHITGFTSDQRIEQKFSFLMTDKASVESFAQAE